jgi:hypothetical protein
MAEYEDDLDAEFKAQAEAAEAEELARQSNKGKGNFEFEKVQYSGLEKLKTRVFRFVGKHPDFGLSEMSRPGDQYDARVINISTILNDKGKRKRFILPLRSRNDQHIMWRIIQKVEAVDWVSIEGKTTKEKVYRIKETFPEIFNTITKNNLDESSNAFKYDLLGKGWKGKEVFVANVIDRSTAWNKDNKKTSVLVKEVRVTTGKDGKEYTNITEISMFGFTSLINTIIKTYGFWEKFDIGIKRTGKQNPAYEVINASRVPEMASADIRDFIVNGPLTEEESTYEKFDLAKIYGVSSYTKLWNNLKSIIGDIDYALKTHFSEELKSLADEEAKNRKEAVESITEEDHPDTDDLPPPEEEAETRSVKKEETRSVNDPDIDDEKTQMPGWFRLSDKESAQIISASRDVDVEDKWNVVYTEQAAGIKMPKCPECATKSPDTFDTCPGCGVNFKF